MKTLLYSFLVVLISLVSSCKKEVVNITPDDSEYYSLRFDTAAISNPAETVTLFNSFDSTFVYVPQYLFGINDEINLDALIINPNNWDVKYFVDVFRNSVPGKAETYDLEYTFVGAFDVDPVLKLSDYSDLLLKGDYFIIHAGAYNGSSKPKIRGKIIK
jgi:hypothetical protein